MPLETYVNAPSSYITKVLQGRSLYEQKIVTKEINRDRHPDIYKSDKGNYQAAYIDLFEPGYHKKNICVDFASYYPSIAMALNLGPDTTNTPMLLVRSVNCTLPSVGICFFSQS